MNRLARELPVAVFDSGVGGLTVLHECLVSLPHEDFLYLGDTARFPYGNRPAAELVDFACELAEILVQRGTKLMVVACNSATAAALPTLRERFGARLPIVSVIEPEAALAVRTTESGVVGLIATPTTVSSGAYERALADASGGAARLVSSASAELASLIQAGGEVDEQTVECVERACEPLRVAGVDTAILGCTHYPLVRSVLQRTLGRGVSIVTSGEAIAETIERELDARGLAAPTRQRGMYSFLATGEPETFRALGSRFLQLPIARVGFAPVGRPDVTGAAA